MEIRVDLSKKIADLPPGGIENRRLVFIGMLGNETLVEFECSNAFFLEGNAIARMVLIHLRCKVPKPFCGRKIWLDNWNSNRKFLLSQPGNVHRKFKLLACLTRLMWQATRNMKVAVDSDAHCITAARSHWHQVAFEKERGWQMQPATNIEPRTSTRDAQADSKTVATQVPVLMYHSVAVTGDSRLRQWRIHPAALEEQLAFLKTNGYYSINSRDLRDALNGKRELYGKPVLLSFDDGLKDFVTNGWPLLKQYGFSAEMFVVTDYVGTRSNWDPVSLYAGPLMSWSDIRALHNEGMEFGSHLATHRYSTRLSMDELFEECVRSRSSLQYHLGFEVCAMAMPYGNWDWRLIKALEWAGFEIGYTVKHGYASKGMNKLLLPRIEIEGEMDIQTFALRLEN